LKALKTSLFFLFSRFSGFSFSFLSDIHFSQLFVAYLQAYTYLSITQKQSIIFQYLSKPVMYNTPKRIIAFILLSAQLLTTTSCSGNFNIPTDQQVAHEHKRLDKKPSQADALVPLVSKELAVDGSLADQLPLESNREASVVPTPVRANKNQSLVSSHAKTAPRIIRSTDHSRKPNKVVDGKRFTTLNKGLDASRKQMQTQELGNVAFVTTPASKQTVIEHSLIAKGGHKIQLKKQGNSWIAIVQENTPQGFSRTLYVDVYLAPGFTIKELSKHSLAWQGAHTAVIFPEKSSSGKGYVYIGDGGLLGGGNSGSKGGGGNDNDRPSSSSGSSERRTSGSSDSSSSSRGRASHNIGSAHSTFSMPKTSSSSSSSRTHTSDSLKDFCNKNSANFSAALSSVGIKHDTHSTSYTSDSFKDSCDKSLAASSAALFSAGIKHDIHSHAPSAALFSAGIKHDTHSTSHTSFSSSNSKSNPSPITSNSTTTSTADATIQAARSSNSESKPATYKALSTSSKASEDPPLTLENAATQVRRHIQETKNDGAKTTSASASQQHQEKGEKLLKQLREIKQQQERSYRRTQTAYITPGNSDIGNKLLLDQLVKKVQEFSTLKELESKLTQSLERQSPSSHYEETKKESIPANATTTPKEIKKDKGKEKDTKSAPVSAQKINEPSSEKPSSPVKDSILVNPVEASENLAVKESKVKTSYKTKMPYDDLRAGVDDRFGYGQYSSTNSSSTPTLPAAEHANPFTSPHKEEVCEGEEVRRIEEIVKELEKIHLLSPALQAVIKYTKLYLQGLKSTLIDDRLGSFKNRTSGQHLLKKITGLKSETETSHKRLQAVYQSDNSSEGDALIEEELAAKEAHLALIEELTGHLLAMVDLTMWELEYAGIKRDSSKGLIQGMASMPLVDTEKLPTKEQLERRFSNYMGECMDEIVTSKSEAAPKNATLQQLLQTYEVAITKFEAAPSNPTLKANKEAIEAKLQAHRLYKEGFELLMLSTHLRQAAEDEADRCIINSVEQGVDGVSVSDLAIASQKSAEADRIRNKLIVPLRWVFKCPNSPEMGRKAVSAVKGAGKSIEDTAEGALVIVSLPVLLIKLGYKSAESIVKWEDKLGVKEKYVSAKEAIKVIFKEAKYDWENVEEYRTRQQLVRNYKKQMLAYNKAVNAEAYHCGQAEEFGYITMEVIQFFFGEAVIKSAGGALKGNKVAKGVRVAKAATQESRAAEAAAGIAEKIKNILKPAGELIGKQVGSDAAIRTVAENEAKNVIDQLIKLGAKKVSKPPIGYKGIWYELPGGKGFGIRTKPSSKSVKYSTNNTIDLHQLKLEEIVKLKY
jgi:hypothetical protein